MHESRSCARADSYWIGCVFQAAVLPGLAAWALCDWWSAVPTGNPLPPTLRLWLLSSGGDGGATARAWYHYAFFGYIVKDCLIPMTPILYVHHAVCLVLTVCALIGVALPPCSAVFVVGVTVLELGSLALSFHCQWPHATWSSPLLAVAMSASNLALCLLGWWFTLYHGTGGWSSRLGFAVVVQGLCLARQQTECGRWRGGGGDGGDGGDASETVRVKKA